MSSIFIRLLNLSITASWLIIAIILIRPLLKKAPKWIGCGLWALVAVRLICPFSIKSALSLIPSTTIIPYDIAVESSEVVNQGMVYGKVAKVSSLQTLINVLTYGWLVGMAALLIYAIISYVRLKRSLVASIVIDSNVRACDESKSPFILGIIRPVIYVPSYMNGATLSCVIAHENAHIKRRDYLWKPLGYLLLTVYWFNPLCWLAYVLLCKDIELACDEKVIREMDRDDKATYSQALLDCNFPRKRIVACPVAFGEVGVKERVKSVLNYKKPAFWILAISLLACVVVMVCFLTNPREKNITSNNSENVEKKLSIEEQTAILTRECAAVIKRSRWDEDSITEFVAYVDKYRDGDIYEAIEFINSIPDNQVVVVVSNLRGLKWPIIIADSYEEAVEDINTIK